MSKAKLSIIVPCFNSEKTIGALLRSVKDQTYSDYEIIFVDGGSSDSTLELIKASYIQNVKIISEKDEGIYDAMNKGIDISTGDWLFFIGSDDYFLDRFLFEDIFKKSYEGYDLVVGRVNIGQKRIFKSMFSKQLLWRNSVHHQGVFYGREIFDSFKYDLKYKVVGDYELNLKCFFENRKIIYLEKVFVMFSIGGLSSQLKFNNYKELMSIRRKYVIPKSLRLLCDGITMCVYLFKMLKKIFKK